MIKEFYNVGLADCDFATITKNEENEYNPYEVKMNICFADYESAIAFIQSAGFIPIKQIIKEGEEK